MPRHDLLQYSATPEPVEVGFTKSAPSLSKPAATMAAAAAASEFDIGRGAPLVVSEESNSPSSGRGDSADTTGSVEAIPLGFAAGVALPRSLDMGQANGTHGQAGAGVLGKRKASDDVDDRNGVAQRHGFAASAGSGPSSSFASAGARTAVAAHDDLPMPATICQPSMAHRPGSSINLNSKVSRMSTAMAPAPAPARPAPREPTAKAGSAQVSARMGAGQPKKVTARKRAADAQAAVLDSGHATPPAPTSMTAPSGSGPSARKQPHRALPLDFARIRTYAPTPLELPPRSRARLFGLEHCPVFYPTVDEFAHPMAYIERVANETREAEFGICKIVPPKGWQPPFALDTETFRFSTRLQRLNSMEASARANINFLEQLYLFHRQHQSSKVSIPVIGSKPVNLWLLRKEVNALGGVEVMSDRRKWKQVGKAMGYDCKADNTIAGELRTAFHKIVQPFEDYRIRVTASGASGNAPTPGTPGSAGATGLLLPSSGSSKGKERATTPSNNADAAVTMEQVYAASNKLNDALNASPAQIHAHMQGANGSSHVARQATPLANSASMDLSFNPHWQPGEYCEVCKSGEDDSSILLCDDCDKGYHLRCLDPPLEAVPKGHWICDTCIIDTGRDYGFEEGHEHTFGSFFQRASSFRQKWLASRPPPPSSAPFCKDKLAKEWRRELDIEDHLEREFWRLVESPHEIVEVEYGADLHTTKGGSAIPTIESHPTEPYARDGWNLNNLPILPGGLLRYVKSDISGMTVPWGYVGMLFSTFAWHKEDHHTYSVNYHHMGGTKTWYGVPGEDDEILEAAMKAAAPELFEQQPDLLWQLVTIFSPGRLKKAGVRVSVCDQRANEFVITLPKAYHAGFNHDFNYNEAVNFCLPDWLSYDLECVRKYREMCKPPVFSHDELLVTVYRQEASVNASRWLLPLFDEMVTRELGRRQQAVATIPGLQVVREDLATSDGHREERSEDYYQCITDKSFCYLSQITLPGLDHVVCVDHWQALPAGQHPILVTRFTEDELLEMLAEVQRRASGDGVTATA